MTLGWCLVAALILDFRFILKEYFELQFNYFSDIGYCNLRLFPVEVTLGTRFTLLTIPKAELMWKIAVSVKWLFKGGGNNGYQIIFCFKNQGRKLSFFLSKASESDHKIDLKDFLYFCWLICTFKCESNFLIKDILKVFYLFFCL